MSTEIAVLLTCFNRREITLKCLKNLFNQEIDIDVFLVDDGSTDGTSEAIRARYPQVILIEGDGTLFWNRGMRLAWQTALQHKKKYGFFIWLNDDTQIYEGSLSHMISYSKQQGNNAILCAATNDAATGLYTYGGRDEDLAPVEPDGTFQKIHYMNGNFVLVPDAVVEEIGILDAAFRHHLGDYDYGLRAAKKGIAVYTTPIYLGSCSKNEMPYLRGRKPNTNLAGRFRFLYSPMGIDPAAQFTYMRRHFGWGRAVKEFIMAHLNNIISNRIHRFYQKKIKS